MRAVPKHRSVLKCELIELGAKACSLVQCSPSFAVFTKGNASGTEATLQHGKAPKTLGPLVRKPAPISLPTPKLLKESLDVAQHVAGPVMLHGTELAL